MKKLFAQNKFYLLSFLLFSFVSCDELISEDEKITEVMIGRFYEDDEELENGSLIKDISTTFYDDGTFISKATMVMENDYDEMYRSSEALFYLEGQWKIKNKFIYYTYHFDRFKVVPSDYNYLLEAIKEKLQVHNSPDEVLSYNEAKIVYQTVEGKVHTMKKSI